MKRRDARAKAGGRQILCRWCQPPERMRLHTLCRVRSAAKPPIASRTWGRLFACPPEQRRLCYRKDRLALGYFPTAAASRLSSRRKCCAHSIVKGLRTRFPIRVPAPRSKEFCRLLGPAHIACSSRRLVNQETAQGLRSFFFRCSARTLCGVQRRCPETG